MSEKKRSPIFWVLIGCGGLAFIGLVIAGVIGYLGYTKIKEIEKGIKDPETRDAKVKQILGTDTFPEGYYPAMGFSLFSVFEMAILTDRPEGFSEEKHGDLGNKAFFYMKFPQKKKQDLKDFLEGKTDNNRALRDANINIDVKMQEIISRGVFEMDGGKTYFLIQKGDMHSDYGSSTDGLQAIMLFECEQSSKAPFGMWFRKMEEGQDLDAEVLTQELKDFIGFFHFCEVKPQ
ncbi:MAG: hypothetical protein H6510_01740 [Acidobacteria bacterium]|nr:hypothetical protein [Acidobacteriota bacterium]MCB9396513.1 hypothetical protein [Acidobacteriota bacterium]